MNKKNVLEKIALCMFYNPFVKIMLKTILVFYCIRRYKNSGNWKEAYYRLVY